MYALNTNKLIEGIKICLVKQLDFVAFSPYGSETVSLLISNEVTSLSFSEISSKLSQMGFVVAPFSNREKLYWFEPHFFFENIEKIDLKQLKNIPACAGKMVSIDDNLTEHDFEDYSRDFYQFKEAIDNGEVKKAILSRVKIINDIELQRSAKYFDIITKMYPESFSFILHSAETGLWLGMTPELFLNIENETVTTVSLAGTKSIMDLNREWSNKETHEQDIVSIYIKDIFSKFNIKELETIGPSTIIAGSVAHLKTIFKFPLKYINNSLGEFIQTLHPTPAVCGDPKEKAVELIQRVEKHNRELYSGFLGPVGLLGNTTLYVTIRCMKFYNNKAALYIGGGITKGSVLKEEWDETEMKGQALLSVVLNS